MISKRIRFWFLVYPDLTKPVGGVKQIHRVAETLQSLGYEAILVQDSESFHPSWFKSRVSAISKKDWFAKLNELTDSDYVVIAETFLPIIRQIPSFIPIIIFNQNGAYSFGLPKFQKSQPSKVLSLYHQSRVVQVWCVSEHDRQLLTQGFNLPASKVFHIPNNIDSSGIRSDIPKQRAIAFFTRKNSSDQDVVVEMLRSRSWLSVGNSAYFILLTSGSLRYFYEVLIYLSFGHPEDLIASRSYGFTLRCGCHTGLGGRELFNRAELYKCAVAVEFGDWLGFIDGLAFIHHRLTYQEEEVTHQLSSLSAEIIQSYGPFACSNALKVAIYLSLDTDYHLPVHCGL